MQDLAHNDLNQSTFNEDLSSLPDESEMDLLEEDKEEEKEKDDEKRCGEDSTIDFATLTDGESIVADNENSEFASLATISISRIRAPASRFGRFITRFRKPK